jgi:hypothetical protein
MKPNPAPAWVNRNLNRYWAQIGNAAPVREGRAVMPIVHKQTKRGKKTFEELGCGHYGCVIQSTHDGIVFKLTSDESEAAFVSAACSIGEFPYGIVRYYKIAEVPERHRGRRVFALWREEASLIGFPMQIWSPGAVTDAYMRRSWKELLDSLDSFKKSANHVRQYVRKAKDKIRALGLIEEKKDYAWRVTRDGSEHAIQRARGAERAAIALQFCEDTAEVMEHTHQSDQIGGALSFYIEQGILLADVHANNVGVITRPPSQEYDDWHGVNAITDPGHMVPLDPRWLDVEVSTLLDESG